MLAGTNAPLSDAIVWFSCARVVRQFKPSTITDQLEKQSSLCHYTNVGNANLNYLRLSAPGRDPFFQTDAGYIKKWGQGKDNG